MNLYAFDIPEPLSQDDLVLLVPGYTCDPNDYSKVRSGAIYLGIKPDDVFAAYKGKTYRLVEVDAPWTEGVADLEIDLDEEREADAPQRP